MQAATQGPSIWEIVDSDALSRTRGGSGARPAMSQTIPVVTLATLVVLLMITKERKYEMTRTGLLLATGVLAAWFIMLLWNFG
jgi:hypothetical protein